MGPLGRDKGAIQLLPPGIPTPEDSPPVAQPVRAPRTGGVARLPEYRLMTPTRFAAAAEVIAEVRSGVTVLVDISAMAASRGQRLVDYACGGVCALGGQTHRIGNDIFLFAPALLRIDED